MMNRVNASILLKTPLSLLLVAIAGLIAYSNTFDVPFQFDDHWNIVENALIHDLSNFISSAKGYDYNPRRYVAYLTFALNYRIGGVGVTGYHILNLAIHIVNGILVYCLVMLTFRTPVFGDEKLEGGDNSPLPPLILRGGDEGGGVTTHSSLFPIPYSRFVALFSALVFVVHPAQTQAVTYIVQRFTSLAALFYLLSVVTYVKGRLVTQQVAVSRQQSAINVQQSTMRRFTVSAAWYLSSVISAVLAMKTKEIAFTLPVVLLLYECIFFTSSLKRKLVFLIPVLLTLVIIPMSIMGVNRPLGEILSDLSEQTRVQSVISRGDYLMTEMRVIVTYIRLIFLPMNQNLDYDYPVYHSFFTPSVFLSFLFLFSILGTALCLLYRTRQEARGEGQGGIVQLTGHDPRFTEAGYYRLIAFGILWFFIALSVESSVIPIADVIFEHRLYLPSTGVFLALAGAVCVALIKVEKKLPGAKRTVFVLAVIVVAALSGVTWARNTVWKDSLTLWKDVVGKAPANARAHNNLGYVYNARGGADEAIEQFITALKLRPGYLDARINLGIAYNAKGRADEALQQFMIALSMDPEDADAHNNIGIVYVSKGRIDEGIRHYQIALRLKADYPEAYNNLGVAYGSKGMFDQAKENFEHAITLKPDYFEANYNLALVYEKTGDYKKATALFSKAKGMNSAYR